MTGLPPGIKVEVEFVAGIWTDITADVDAKQPISWHIGRTSPFTDPATAQTTITVANATGLYTPQRQVLADGVTAHPYWPNVDVRKRLRVSYTIGGTQYVRFLGYIKQWLPQLADDGFQQQCQIVVADRLDQLSRVRLKQTVRQEIDTDNPTSLYMMDEPVGSLAALDQVGSGGRLLIPAGGAFAAALPVAIPDGLTGLTLPGPGAGGLTEFTATLPAGNITALECWITLTGGTVANPMQVDVAVRDRTATLGSGFPTIQFSVGAYAGDGNGVLEVLAEVDGTPPAANIITTTANDGLPHHCVISQISAGNWTVFLDGVAVTVLPSVVGSLPRPFLQFDIEAIPSQSVTYGPVAVYSTALSAARVLAHYQAGVGYAGETTGNRVARLLGYAGLAAADMNVSAGRETMTGAQPMDGKAVLDATRECATTEGGGAALYVAPDGRVRFPDRTFRKPGNPVMTIDAGADLDAGTFAPSYDELTLVNSSTVTRQGGTAQTFTDAASEAAYNLTSESGVTSYADTDAAALHLAEWRVRSQCTPGLRLAQVAVDLLTATTAGLYLTMTAVQIGSRLRVTSLDATASARPTIDLIAEGWTETVAIDQYTIVYDTSRADNPALFVLDSATYGRLSPAPGAATVQTAITAASTTLKIAMATGPTFTLVPAMYPMNIGIGAEVLTLTAPPSGSSSPQTFTGVLRGQANTSAAAQAAGSQVTLAPSPTVTL